MTVNNRRRRKRSLKQRRFRRLYLWLCNFFIKPPNNECDLKDDENKTLRCGVTGCDSPEEEFDEYRELTYDEDNTSKSDDQQNEYRDIPMITIKSVDSDDGCGEHDAGSLSPSTLDMNRRKRENLEMSSINIRNASSAMEIGEYEKRGKNRRRARTASFSERTNSLAGWDVQNFINHYASDMRVDLTSNEFRTRDGIYLELPDGFTESDRNILDLTRYERRHAVHIYDNKLLPAFLTAYVTLKHFE